MTKDFPNFYNPHHKAENGFKTHPLGRASVFAGQKCRYENNGASFDVMSAFECSPMASGSKNHFGFKLESLFWMSPYRKQTDRPHSPLKVTNPDGVLGMHEGHVNASSRADISRFFIRTRGPIRSGGYERHMGREEWETQDGLYKEMDIHRYIERSESEGKRQRHCQSQQCLCLTVLEC